MIARALIVALGILMSGACLAQGEDSLMSERDNLVIAEMLPGTYKNANQAYFEGRTGVDENLRHNPLQLDISAVGEGGSEFSVLLTRGEAGDETATYRAILSTDAANDAVMMLLNDESGKESCNYQWRREAMQFRATANRRCSRKLPAGFVLSAQQFWVVPGKDSGVAADNPYRLHRAREFGCYVDIPGVGGGRDIPYERYDGFKLNDQGDSYWFDTREEPSRRIGVTLFQVDWPLNNYKGVFTRDSLVIYVSEEIDGEKKEHGYSFTEPDANRLGINLKWLLASCFMLPNSEAVPTM